MLYDLFVISRKQLECILLQFDMEDITSKRQFSMNHLQFSMIMLKVDPHGLNLVIIAVKVYKVDKQLDNSLNSLINKIHIPECD